MRLAFSERYVIGLNFLLIAGCAYFAALSVNSLAARRLIVIPRMGAVEQAPPPAPPASRAAYDLIAARDIFNPYQPPVPAAPPPPVVVDLHLQLLGISLATRAKSYAIVEDQNTHEQAVYREGEDIPSAGHLFKIEATRILIDHEGKTVVLSLPNDTPGTDSASLPMPPIRRLPMVGGKDVHQIRPGQFLVEKAAVDRSLQNMGQLFTQMRALPDFVNGKTDGFRLSEVVPGSIFQQMGLQDGDVVTSVGGQDLSDPTQAIMVLNSLRNQTSISLTVMRNGVPVNLTYDIR